MVTILMMSAYLASPGLLKIKIFPSKGYNVIIPDFDVTNKILSRDANYIADVVMWPKFGNCSISMREVIITSILKRIWPEKLLFLRGGLGLTSTRYDLEVLHQCGRGVKTKSQKSLGGNSNVCRSYRGKTGGGAFLSPPAPPSWIGLTSMNCTFLLFMFKS